MSLAVTCVANNFDVILYNYQCLNFFYNEKINLLCPFWKQKVKSYWCCMLKCCWLIFFGNNLRYCITKVGTNFERDFWDDIKNESKQICNDILLKFLCNFY